jgi:hypothetical protein
MADPIVKPSAAPPEIAIAYGVATAILAAAAWLMTPPENARAPRAPTTPIRDDKGICTEGLSGEATSFTVVATPTAAVPTVAAAPARLSGINPKVVWLTFFSKHAAKL